MNTIIEAFSISKIMSIHSACPFASWCVVEFDISISVDVGWTFTSPSKRNNDDEALKMLELLREEDDDENDNDDDDDDDDGDADDTIYFGMSS